MGPTPEATIGPFYPGAFVDALPQDLWTVSSLASHHPQGQRIAVTFRVWDAVGAPVPSVVIESWQANAHGRYRHPADRSDRPHDPQFDGFARLRTGEDGVARLETVMPGGHPVHDSDVMRAPHLRLTIFASGIDRVVTQVFFDGEPMNPYDPVLTSIAEAGVRQRLVARRAAAADGSTAREYVLDLVLRGDAETPFFDDWD